jgi:histidinol-phosphatase (PHP family)
MIRQNLHTHSIWDDGKNTLDDMVRAALFAGMTSLGFSVHSYLPFAPDWSQLPEKFPAYAREVQALKQAQTDGMPIYHAVEWDILSETDLSQFDYVIGAIHQIATQGGIYSVDGSPKKVATYLQDTFGGDSDAAAEAYFRQYDELAQVDEVDIVAHFDLITKFNDLHGFYNTDSPRYRAAALSAMDALVAAGKIFEVNTGAVARGYRKTPYPSRDLLLELKKRGARVTVSSDAHAADEIAFGLAGAEALIGECGFTELWIFDGRAFVPVPVGDA